MIKKFEQIDFRFLCLAAMLVFLPGIEALKNIFALLFVISWAVYAKRTNYWGGKWRLIDSILLFWILAVVFVSINAVVTYQYSGSGFTDTLRFVLIAWTLSRIFFSDESVSKLALIAVLATLVTLAYSYYSTNGELKELHSVGHINHTAIFLLITYSIALPLLLFNFDKLTFYVRVFLSLALVILFSSTIDTESRAAFGIILVVSLINLFYVAIRVKKMALIIVLISIVSFLSIFFLLYPPMALERILIHEHLYIDEARAKINQFSYFMFKANPFFGVGFGNYGFLEINDEIISLIIEEKGVFDEESYFKSAHAHSLYFNYLVSGGLLVFSILIWFWFYICWVAFKLLNSSKNHWILLASVNVVIINLAIGFVNTTMHHEHAILTMFVLGMLLSQHRKNRELELKDINN